MLSFNRSFLIEGSTDVYNNQANRVTLSETESRIYTDISVQLEQIRELIRLLTIRVAKNESDIATIFAALVVVNNRLDDLESSLLATNQTLQVFMEQQKSVNNTINAKCNALEARITAIENS